MTARLSRRQVVRAAASLTAWAATMPLGVGCRMDSSQQPSPQSSTRSPRIGYLATGAPNVPLTDVFRQGLREYGWIEGENILIEYRYASWDTERLVELGRDLASLPVAVIVLGDSIAIPAAMQATSTIPIVMTVSGDVVAEGLVASLARPGGNLTGLTSLSQPLDSKRLEYLKAAVPSIGRVAVLWNTAHPTVATSWRELEVSARAFGLQVTSLGITQADELQIVLSSVTPEGADALLVLPDPLTTTIRKPIVEFALEHRLPSMFGIREAVEEGGLMTYSPDRRVFYQRAADYVDRILKGANPAEMPIERPTRFELILNLKTAQAIGITFPGSILANATSVLQ